MESCCCSVLMLEVTRCEFLLLFDTVIDVCVDGVRLTRAEMYKKYAHIDILEESQLVSRQNRHEAIPCAPYTKLNFMRH